VSLKNAIMLFAPRFILFQLVLVTLSLSLCSSSRAEPDASVAAHLKPALTSTIFAWDKLKVKKTATGERREIV
jgi:hypothetical protein